MVSLKSPGWRQDWHVGVRVKESKKLVAFIAAIPSTLEIRGTTLKSVEINFLCVHKQLRSKRLAPVLIKEITRRVNKQDIWFALYTAGCGATISGEYLPLHSPSNQLAKTV